MAGENDQATQDSTGNTTDEDGLIELFNQFCNLTSPMSDCIEPDTMVVVSEASLQGKINTYQVTIQNLITIALLDTGANIPVVLEMFFKSLHQTPQLLKVCVHKVTSASGANLGLIGECDLTFRLGNKQVTDRFIVLCNLCKYIILGLNWQCNDRKGCNWNVNGQQYITHNKKSLCTSTPSANMESIV